ncbi:MAG: hypothetical protein NXH74_02175 [Rhodobacteraceae bacterium]|jgi:hypothetical protein|nr:hypothetical protein [Paracoccaceae bacterium]
MRYVWMLVLCLAGCNGPGQDFRDAAVTRVELGGAVFDVRVLDRRAEALRVNPQAAPRLAAIAPQAVMAIEQVSGCRVDRLTGDQAMMHATLDCGRGAPSPRYPTPYLECDAFDLEDGAGTLLCYPF